MRLIAAAGLIGGLAVAACAPTPTPEPATPQRCDAATAGRELIGSHVGAVTFAPDANVRIVCTKCAATDDYRPYRMNVRFDEATGIIRAVDCG